MFSSKLFGVGNFGSGGSTTVKVILTPTLIFCSLNTQVPNVQVKTTPNVTSVKTFVEQDRAKIGINQLNIFLSSKVNDILTIPGKIDIPVTKTDIKVSTFQSSTKNIYFTSNTATFGGAIFGNTYFGGGEPTNKSTIVYPNNININSLVLPSKGIIDIKANIINIKPLIPNSTTKFLVSPLEIKCKIVQFNTNEKLSINTNNTFIKVAINNSKESIKTNNTSFNNIKISLPLIKINYVVNAPTQYIKIYKNNVTSLSIIPITSINSIKSTVPNITKYIYTSNPLVSDIKTVVFEPRVCGGLLQTVIIKSYINNSKIVLQNTPNLINSYLFTLPVDIKYHCRLTSVSIKVNNCSIINEYKTYPSSISLKTNILTNSTKLNISSNYNNLILKCNNITINHFSAVSKIKIFIQPSINIINLNINSINNIIKIFNTTNICKINSVQFTVKSPVFDVKLKYLVKPELLIEKITTNEANIVRLQIVYPDPLNIALITNNAFITKFVYPECINIILNVLNKNNIDISTTHNIIKTFIPIPNVIGPRIIYVDTIKIFTNIKRVQPTLTVNGANYSLLLEQGGPGFKAGDLIVATSADYDYMSNKLERYNIGAEVIGVKVDPVTGEEVVDIKVLYGANLLNSEGQEFVRVGSTTDPNRRGGIFMTSIDDNAPYIAIMDGINKLIGNDQYTYKDPRTYRVFIGNLTTVSGLIGISNPGYGIYTDNGSFKGRITCGNATSLTTGTGFFVDKDGNFRVGDPSGNYAKWSNNVLEIKGTITATAGKIGGFTIEENILWA